MEIQNIKEWKSFKDSNKCRDLFYAIYDEKDLNKQIKRYDFLIRDFLKTYKRETFALFSSSGRTELVGNHTDHNNGKVLAASINLDAITAASPNGTSVINLISTGYKRKFSIDTKDLKVKKDEIGRSEALIRGIAAGFKNAGYKVEGFDSYTSSDVLSGSGLSSSACFEVLTGEIINHFFNKGSISYLEISKIGQFAENKYFGKPCGLMDQIACAAGGIVSIDFKNEKKPLVSRMNFDFKKSGYDLVIVNTGGSHADLTDDYASIPDEMKKIAGYFKKKKCSEIDFKNITANFDILKKSGNDRALLRAIHFFNENKRTEDAVRYLKQNKIDQYFRVIKESGDSSFKYLQNIYSLKNFREQKISLALILTERFLEGDGACRVHGGGFAGTIQVYVPCRRTQSYLKYIENFFGKKSSTLLSVRNNGALRIF